MQHRDMDTAQAPPAGDKSPSADLPWAIPGMAATISRQHQELMELKEALQEIL